MPFSNLSSYSVVGAWGVPGEPGVVAFAVGAVAAATTVVVPATRASVPAKVVSRRSRPHSPGEPSHPAGWRRRWIGAACLEARRAGMAGVLPQSVRCICAHPPPWCAVADRR